jgi:hypothetical protein
MNAFLAEPSPVPVLVMLKSKQRIFTGTLDEKLPKRAGGRPRKRPMERPLETLKRSGPGWQNRRLHWRAAIMGGSVGFWPTRQLQPLTFPPLNGYQYKTATFNPKE